MSAKPTRQIERRSYHAWLRERWSYKPLVSRDEEWIRFGQRRQAFLVLDIPTGSLIFTAIFAAILAAHADPFMTLERRASQPGWTGEGARPSTASLRRRGKPRLYWSLAYSALASWRSGRSGSASFQAARKF